MPRPNKTVLELGLIRNFWDTCGEMEADYNGATAMFVNRTRRPGVCSFRLVFTPLVGTAENLLGTVAVQFEYPNSTIQTLAGTLWRAALDLHKMVAEASLDAKRAQANRH